MVGWIYNQPIVYIDDPVTSQAKITGDESAVQRFKNIISSGDVQVEVKGGSMVFDSSLIIITSNIDPSDLANSCGIDNNQDSQIHVELITSTTEKIVSRR